MQNNRNGAPVTDFKYSLQAVKSVTFDGATTNDIGDYDGTGNPATLFTVTGPVLIEVVGYPSVDLTGATATLEVGITGATAQFIAQTTGTDIDAGEIWHDASPDAKVEASTVMVQQLLNDTDIIQTVGTANITAGAITYVAYWYPLSPDASVVAA